MKAIKNVQAIKRQFWKTIKAIKFVEKFSTTLAVRICKSKQN